MKASALDRLLDRTVVLAPAGFTKFGYQARRGPGRPIDASLENKTMVVTGATSGLGLATARSLARLGATVVLVGRDRGRTEAALNEVRAAVPDVPVTAELADLSLMSEVRALAERLLAAHPEVHGVVNNAGTLFPEREVTDEGIERTLATNLLSHFLLTNLLIPRLVASAPARIVNVSSGGMYTQRIAVDDLQSASDPYQGARAYARTKRGQVILTEMWAEQLAGTGVTVNSMHPGWADTPGLSGSLPGFRRLIKSLLRTPEQGADTIVWLAASNQAREHTGEFWLDRTPRPTHLLPGTRETDEERLRLWERLTELSGWEGGPAPGEVWPGRSRPTA